MTNQALPSLADIERVRSRVAPHVHRTPLLHVRSLGEPLGAELWLKAETFQRTGSYKPRGIVNRLLALSPEVRQRGVITVSAGNAAQAVAYAAARIGCPAIAVMPENASLAKVEATKAYGAQIVLHGTSPEAFARAKHLAAEHGYTFIAPSDHPDVITGHAAIGLEILEDLPDVDLILVPVGAGGLGAGIATAIAASGASARVVGVEPEGANSMALSLEAGRPTDLPGPPATIADGLAYPFGGQHTFPIFRDHVERVLSVPDASIQQAMWLIMTRAKLYAEPSGAAGLAGLLTQAEALRPFRKIVCVISGGNIDPASLAQLAQP
ncbi:MAG: pyridoxal-phosphate dependent enzyme [Pigmentiphaga sp.]|nr:pyridoxal-phosphate dependent enzyme [Pigmentiphaga sp.]